MKLKGEVLLNAILVLTMTLFVFGLGFIIGLSSGKSKYISFPEEIGAVKSGDTLVKSQIGDTIFLSYGHHLQPHEKQIVVIP